MTAAGATTHLESRTRSLAGDVDLLDALPEPDFAWLREGVGFVTRGVAARIPVAGGPDRLERAAAEVAALLGAVEIAPGGDDGGWDDGGWDDGGWDDGGWDDGGWADGGGTGPGSGPIAVASLPFSPLAPGELVVPAVVVGRRPDGGTWITTTGPPGGAGGRDAPAPGPGLDPPRPADGPVPVNGSNDLSVLGDEAAARSRWRGAVDEALAAILAGRLDKVVLARRLLVEAPRAFVRRRVLDALRRSHPGCFTYAWGGFVGASPELLLRRRGSRVASQPMAGSVPLVPGDGGREDEARLARLRASAKDAEEHRLLVEAVVEGLRPVCLDLDAPPQPEVVRLATVAHLATTVIGRLRDPEPSVLALVGRLHPTPAVAGIPRSAALAAIPRLEGFERGRYAGPVGWVDARGDGEWALALRCAEIEGRRARLFAGAGIVAGSDPEAEWEETEAKLRPMLAALHPGPPSGGGRTPMGRGGGR